MSEFCMEALFAKFWEMGSLLQNRAQVTKIATQGLQVYTQFQSVRIPR